MNDFRNRKKIQVVGLFKQSIPSGNLYTMAESHEIQMTTDEGSKDKVTDQNANWRDYWRGLTKQGHT